MITIRKANFKDLPKISKLVLGQFVKEINSHIKELEAEKEGIKLSLDTELAQSKIATDTAKLLQENNNE